MANTIETLQNFRMLALWPVIVGTTTFFVMRLVLLFVNNSCRLSHVDVAACVVVGGMASLMAVAISVLWQNSSPAWWVFFTVGLVVQAVVMLVTAIQLAIRDAKGAHGHPIHKS